jgi:carbamoyltransferase
MPQQHSCRKLIEGTGIEVLVCENCFLVKEEQDPELAEDYKDKFELD